MKTYSLTEAQRLLAVTPKQLRRWLADMGIEPVRASFDQRVQMLTDDQIERVRLGLPSQALPARPSPANDQALAQRVAVLERQVALLLRQRSGPPIPAPETRVPVINSNFGTNGSAGQIGAISKRKAAKLAFKHGGKSTDSALRWYEDPADLADLESVIRRAQGYLAGHPNAGTWRECDDPACPCHQI